MGQVLEDKVARPTPIWHDSKLEHDDLTKNQDKLKRLKQMDTR